MKKFKVSQSKLKCWRECRFKYYGRHVLKLMKRAKPRPLYRGSVIHDMIEAWTNRKDPWAVYKAAMKEARPMFEAELEVYGDLPLEIKTIMKGYFDFYRKDGLKYKAVNGARCEFRFEVDLTPSILLVGNIDALPTSPDGLRWTMEHKSHKQIPVGEFKFTDIQSGLYTWAAPRAGLGHSDGVLWNYLKAKMPTVPSPLKDGTMSRRNIDTTWGVYRQALIDNALDPKDYDDMRERLIGNEVSFFSRVYMATSKHMLDTLVEEAISTAREIKRKAGKDTTRNIGRHCEWCDMNMLCRAKLLGHDWEMVAEQYYTHNDYEERRGYVDTGDE